MYIYKITNTINGDFYIGKTTKTIEDRFQKHYYNHKLGQTYLYRAMRKYGFENFSVEIVETNPKDIDAAEIKYILEMNPTYNMTSGGEGGNTSSSPNFIKAMKESHQKRPPESYASYGMLGKSHPGKGKRHKGKRVSCDGIIFDSIQLAQDHFVGISVRKRLSSDKYPTFFRI
jgi:group I intron endonuclease